MAWHIAVSDISDHHVHGQNDMDRRSVLLFRKDEFRTPSPLLPSWHRSQPSYDAPVDEDSNDDFYFHSSDSVVSDLQLADIMPMNYGPDNGSELILRESSDNYYLSCRNAGVTNSYGHASRFIKVESIPIKSTRAESPTFDSRRLVIGRSKQTYGCV